MMRQYGHELGRRRKSRHLVGPRKKRWRSKRSLESGSLNDVMASTVDHQDGIVLANHSCNRGNDAVLSEVAELCRNHICLARRWPSGAYILWTVAGVERNPVGVLIPSLKALKRGNGRQFVRRPADALCKSGRKLSYQFVEPRIGWTRDLALSGPLLDETKNVEAKKIPCLVPSDIRAERTSASVGSPPITSMPAALAKRTVKNTSLSILLSATRAASAISLLGFFPDFPGKPSPT